MSALGDVINNAVGAATGTSGGTTLQNFLSRFGSAEGKWINQLDPLNTFDLTFEFQPAPKPKKNNASTLEKIGGSLVGSAQSAVKEGLNSITGGLLGSFMNSKVDLMKQKKSFKQFGKETFMEWLASANLLVGAEDWIGEKAGQAIRPLELQLGLYCQEITIPNLKTVDGGKITSLLGEFPVNGNYIMPDNNNLVFTFVNTKVPLMERIFYPWMREVTLPWWSYDSQPYTTATITVDFTKHSDIKYKFFGARPIQINMQQANQDPSGDNLKRQVTIMFDYMIVTSDLGVTESVKDKLLGSGKTLFNSASKLVNF